MNPGRAPYGPLKRGAQDRVYTTRRAKTARSGYPDPRCAVRRCTTSAGLAAGVNINTGDSGVVDGNAMAVARADEDERKGGATRTRASASAGR